MSDPWLSSHSCWANGIERALFSRALAELKYMGMIRNSRKKADHIAKLSWKGL